MEQESQGPQAQPPPWQTWRRKMGTQKPEEFTKIPGSWAKALWWHVSPDEEAGHTYPSSQCGSPRGSFWTSHLGPNLSLGFSSREEHHLMAESTLALMGSGSSVSSLDFVEPKIRLCAAPNQLQRDAPAGCPTTEGPVSSASTHRGTKYL